MQTHFFKYAEIIILHVCIYMRLIRDISCLLCHLSSISMLDVYRHIQMLCRHIFASVCTCDIFYAIFWAAMPIR